MLLFTISHFLLIWRFVVNLFMSFDISILLKLAFTVVKDVYCDVNCVKCNFSQLTHSSPQSKSKGKHNECLFSTPSIL